MRIALLSFAGLLVFGGCDDHLLGETEDTAGEETYTSDWAGVESFFVDHCDSCHADGDPFDMHEVVTLDLSDGDDTNNLYVIPGDCDSSVLWQVVTWTGTVIPMPLLASEPLSDASTAHICEWINNGAPL